MKFAYFAVAAISGLFGLLAMIRIIEDHLNGAPINWFMFVIAALGIILARFWSRRGSSLK